VRPALVAALGPKLPDAPGVGNAPGAIATVRMPFGPHSTARLLVIASTAVLPSTTHREGTAGNGRGREDREHHALVLALDPASAGGQRAIHRACSVGARIASAARNDRCSLCAMKVAAALLTRTSIGASCQTESPSSPSTRRHHGYRISPRRPCRRTRCAVLPRFVPAIRAVGRK